MFHSQIFSVAKCCGIQGSHLICYLWISLIIDQSECLVCNFLCTRLTLFCIILPENCIYLNQSELSNFFMYVIIMVTAQFFLHDFALSQCWLFLQQNVISWIYSLLYGSQCGCHVIDPNLRSPVASYNFILMRIGFNSNWNMTLINTWQLPPCISCLKSLSHGIITSLHITANHPCDYTCKVKWLTKQLELCGNKYFLIVLLFLIWFNSNLLKCFVLHSVITARKVPITQLCHKSTFLSKSIQVLYCKYTILINE